MEIKGIGVIALLAIIVLAVAGFSTLAWQKKEFQKTGTADFKSCSGFCSMQLIAEELHGSSPAQVSIGTGLAKDIAKSPALQDNVQVIYIHALANGNYDKPVITVKRGVPVRLHFTADRNAGCGRFFVLDEFKVELLPKGDEEAVAEFVPNKPGTYPYHCGMWMWKGKMIVE